MNSTRSSRHFLLWKVAVCVSIGTPWSEHDLAQRFFVLATFTGLPKPAHFLDARSEPRFAKFAHKIIYHLFQGRAPKRGESPFAVEAEQRDDMTTLIKSQIEATRPSTPPLVIMSDVDEIPSAHTVNLLRSCAAPLPMHLEMRMYLYSFEWEISGYSWRAQVHEWNAQSMYRHSMSSDLVLADSGWHCR
jgi:beta-1,4-mannosyl-glycoprotein beta-1,4-N-acetylglucosaminyltransferase